MGPRLFVRGDVDGFFGLFIDNLLQLMLIVELAGVAGLPPDLVTGRILPGAALSILAGNFFYAWQAWRLARRAGRDDVTALPYGINTVSLVAYIFLVIAPVYRQTGSVDTAWRAGLFACLASAVFEIAGAFAGDALRRNTPRAALLAALAGIALTFISMGFVFQIFASPAVAVVPMMLILALYASRVRLPGGLPGGFVAVVVGTAFAWILRGAGLVSLPPPAAEAAWGFHPPRPVDLFALLAGPAGWTYMSVIIPMGLFNVIGSLQNLESAEAAGDRFETRPSLLANGVGSLVAALFGSAFPTTIYIGHPAWKAMGARIGYSVANGLAVAALCFSGGVAAVLAVVPLEVTLGILLWIGLIIAAQAFQAVPARHAPAVALGLVPSLAAWALFLIETSLRATGASLAETAERFGNALYVHGAIALSQGSLLSSMVLAAILVFAIERRFRQAAGWALAAAALSTTGLIHAYVLTPAGVEYAFGYNAAPAFTVAYAATAVVFLFIDFREPGAPRPPSG